MSLLNSPFHPAQPEQIQPEQPAISSIDAKLSRTNYYDGRLLKASDLIRDQLYLDERLREVGRVLGQGIVRGLLLSLSSKGELSVSPGLAVAPSGRVLELENTSFKLNLLDSAAIAALNQGYRRLERGLYAVVLQYAEEGRGSAEVYPRDLQQERGFHFNAFAEGVELVLTPLHTRLPYGRQHEYHRLNNSVMSRSALVREMILPHRGQPLGISEEGVALGLIAVENGQPVWLDHGLVRRPHRQPLASNALQTDLFHHYEELLSDVLTLRQQSTRGSAFKAQHYFDVLPPFGSIPKDCVDPINGYQHYFPEGFEVSISPVRNDDLEALVQQSLPLSIIDLKKDQDVDIMILVPMSDVQFAFRARQLQHVTHSSGDDGETTEFVQPAHLDDYQLAAYGQSVVHKENTDSAVWQDIWAEADEVYYLRRPTRVAETQVSAVVLAKGDFEQIADSGGMPPDIQAMTDQIEELETDAANHARQVQSLNQLITNLNQTIEELQKQDEELEAKLEADAASHARQVQKLNQLITKLNQTIDELQNQDSGPLMRDLVAVRPENGGRSGQAIKQLLTLTRDKPDFVTPIWQTMLLMPSAYDAVNWPTVAESVQADVVKELLKLLRDGIGQDFLKVIDHAIQNLPFSSETQEEWQKIFLRRQLT
ncbi:MAG: hypothetical protein P8X74_09575 [Reinekea sp.]